MNLLRPILALLVIFSACMISKKYSEHHVNENVFQQLYLHLVPARLVQPAADHDAGGHDAGANGQAGEHAASEGLISLPLPAALAIMDPWSASTAKDGHEVEPRLHMTNLQVFQIASVFLVFILLGGIPGYLRTGRGDYLTRLFTGFAMYIRDEMIVPVMGKETARKYTPYFLCIFIFILFMNLMGLVPGSATATANIFVTAGLGLITFFSMVICGMVVQGPVAFWKNLVPHVPLPLWPLMFVVEVVGLVVKPFALLIRLFANMTGGHMVVLSFMGLIFLFGQSMGDTMGYGVSLIAIPFAVFIMIIETFVALLQAYIFTQLSILFVNSSIHPEH
ncbi:MAG: F0F1 ATP synthase subunit A [Candidatus Hydrogenedentes bacterium]|nr:F0F1 ATP synthase subunit A [Candidatus Hydrogenedentota bacterium]